MNGDRAVAEADVRISWHLQTPASMGFVKWLFHISLQQRQGNSAAPRPRCLQRNVSSVFESFSGRVAEVMHILSTWKTLGFKRPLLLAPTPPGSEQTPVLQGLLIYKNSHCYFRFQVFYWHHSANFPPFPVMCHTTRQVQGLQNFKLSRLAYFSLHLYIDISI